MIARASAWHDRSTRSVAGAAPARHLMPGGWALVCLLVVNGAMAEPPEEAAQPLKKADDLKTANYPEFVTIVKSLEQQSARLSAGQQGYLRYLEGWKGVYDGDYDVAMSRLQAVIRESNDLTLRFRAGVTLVNLL